MVRAIRLRSRWVLIARLLLVRCVGRAGVRALAVAAAALGALFGAAGCEQILGFGDHEVEAPCGDGSIGPGEGCDDGGTAGGDRCSEACSVEEGFTCVGAPSDS